MLGTHADSLPPPSTLFFLPQTLSQLATFRLEFLFFCGIGSSVLLLVLLKYYIHLHRCVCVSCVCVCASVCRSVCACFFGWIDNFCLRQTHLASGQSAVTCLICYCCCLSTLLLLLLPVFAVWPQCQASPDIPLPVAILATLRGLAFWLTGIDPLLFLTLTMKVKDLHTINIELVNAIYL